MRRRLILGAATIVALLALTAPVASAAPPYHDSYAFPYEDTLTGVCDFPITVEGVITADYTLFFDKEGNWVKEIDQGIDQSTLTANGKTLNGEPVRFMVVTGFANGEIVSAVVSGGISRVPLPDGTVFRSAGRFDFIANSVTTTLTPDTGHSGNVEALCKALS